jgi:hypothetical protein
MTGWPVRKATRMRSVLVIIGVGRRAEREGAIEAARAMPPRRLSISLLSEVDPIGGTMGVRT